MLVLAGYRAQKEGELSLAPGDVVRQVCKGPARGWLRGELGGHCGFFPERLVQVSPGGLLGGRLSPHPRELRAPSPGPHFQEIPETLRGAGEAPRPRCARSRGKSLPGWSAEPSLCGRPTLAPRASLWAELLGRSVACDWFSSTMLRPEQGWRYAPPPARRTGPLGLSVLIHVASQVALPNLGAPQNGAK